MKHIPILVAVPLSPAEVQKAFDQHENRFQT